MLAAIPIGFAAFLIFAIFGAVKHFKRRDKEKEIYANIAKQMNWNFSVRGEGFEAAKNYFEFINQQILPDRIRLGVFPVNILWGNSENALFAVFDFDYNTNPNSSNYNLQREKGVLLVSKNLNLPHFEAVEKDFLVKVIDSYAGNLSSNFAKNYRITTNEQTVTAKFHAPEIARFFENSGIIRALGNGNLLCLFFRRDAEELPDLSRIQMQLEAVWRLAKNL